MQTINQQFEKPNIGLKESEMKGLVTLLQTSLADEFLLYTKLRKYHWNVTGPTFSELHKLFEEQYTEIAIVKDDIAEYIRNYGEFAIGTLTEVLEFTRLTETVSKNPASQEMIQQLIHDHEEIIRNFRKDAKKAIENYNDPQVEDLIVGIIHKHQKMAWMLRATLNK